MPKTTFVATSPFTGEQFTRKSERGYTFAVIYLESMESQQIRAENDAKFCDAQAMKYNEIATFLENGTTPDASHKLCKPLGSVAFTINQYRAGVRTEWDAIEYHIVDGKFADTYSYVPRCTRAEKAAEYRTYEKANINRAKAYRATQIDAPREAATFHHSNLLAVKAMASENKRWTDAKVVPCAPKQK
jgi:hypothetical protein